MLKSKCAIGVWILNMICCQIAKLEGKLIVECIGCGRLIPDCTGEMFQQKLEFGSPRFLLCIRNHTHRSVNDGVFHILWAAPACLSMSFSEMVPRGSKAAKEHKLFDDRL